MAQFTSEISNVKGIAFDIDDTFSSHGKISAEAFSALWRLKSAGYWLVPVTGRPAGWCDHIARFWPVDAVIGENGAFFVAAPEMRLHWIEPRDGLSLQDRRESRRQLEIAIQREFPQAQWASDQAYRASDLAIDFCEDVEPWAETEVLRLEAFCRDQGAQVKRSSIHINTWYGDFDKAYGFESWMKQGPQVPQKWNEWIYLGDSPNDEPQFEKFPLSVGVANIQPYLSRLRTRPRFITAGEAGAGFVEVVDGILGGS